MKKLCTYLTLFVLGLLALAQPAAARPSLTKGVTYYIDASAYSGTIDNVKVWAGNGSDDTAELVAGTTKIYSWTQGTDVSNHTFYIKRNGNGGGDELKFEDDFASIGNNCIKLTGPNWNSGASWTTYGSQGGGETKMYNRGVFTGTNSAWGNNPDVMMPYNEDLRLYYYEPSSAGDFMISTTTGTSFWNGRYQNMAESGKLTLPDSKPASQNIKTGGGDGRDLTLPALGTIYFDKNEMKIWYEEPAVEPTDYTFYLNPGTVAWSDVYVYLFGSSDSKWNGVYEHYTTKLSNGYYKFEVKGVTKAGNMLFKSNNTGNWLGDKTDQSRDIEGTNVKNGALYTLGEMYNNKGYNYTVTENYQEPGAKPVLTANPAGGEFETSVSVTLSATPACDIYYTTNGTEPSAASSKYSSPLSFTATTTLKAVAILDGVSSDVITYTYTKKEEGVYSGSLYAKGPACNNDWNTWAQLSGTDGVFSFDVLSKAQFLITDSNNDDGIYSLDGASSIPVGKANAVKIKRSRGNNMEAPAENGKIFIDMNEMKIWYEPKSFSDTKLYIRAAFIGDNKWGEEKWNKEMTWNESEGVYVWDATSAKTGDQFMISWNMDMWNHKFACDPIPTEKPSTSNVNDDNGNNGSDLKLPKPGYIKYDPVNKILWVAPEQAVLPTLYTFYVKIDDVYASQWGDDTCYLYTFDEGDDKWTSINGQCVKYDRRLADGVYKFVVRGQTSKGRMLFKNTAAVSDMQEYSGTILPADIRPGALYTISAKGEVSVAPEDYVETNVFEAGKAYYVDASACSWFENADCTLGVKYDKQVHYGGTIVKVSSNPLVYRFTVNDDQTEIEVGRRNDQGLHNPVTVQAPTDGSNCIYVKEDNGNLVFDSWGSYSPAGGLYILGSSNAIDGDWKSATPIAMNYDEAEGVYYYMVQGTNASADNPIEFLISRGATNSAFFNAANAFEPVRDGYIHMAEPSYMKGKPGYTDGNYFKLISRGRVMAKYIKAENSEEITGLKIWYEPVVWPDLYALGSIIADPDDTKDIQSTHEQWHTFVKLEKDDKQPGLYYYDLGRNGNENLFNEKPYPVTGGVFGDIDEHGHFNFSFLSGTDTGVFWKDAFVPAVGQGMGTLNRDGVPVPFQYRDSKPDQTEWVSTNFVFGERSRIWVDVVRQLVWIETFTELSGNQVVFDFWDKGGTAYSKEDGYQWWSATDANTHNIQSYLVNEAGDIIKNADSPYTLKASDLSWQSLEVINNVGSGVRYHFVAELPASYYEKGADDKPTDKVANGYHVWIRIKDNANADHEIRRPYAYQATYTQGPKEDIAYNHYGNIKAAGAPIVTIEPSVNMIYADVEAPEHLGLFRESHVMHYPYVNQYSTAVTVNPGNVYPFWVEGLTEEAKDESGNVIADQYVPVAGAPFTFTKSNQVTVSYGSIRETKYGTTGMAVIKGIDHANAAATDKMEVTVTYTSPGLIFARTKTEPLKIDANELPTMQTSQDTPLEVAAFYSGTACNQGLTVDLILHQKFEFRDIMIQGGEADGKIYVPRAAYIGYEVKIDNPNDHSHVVEGQEHMAKNGVPLMWDFTDDHNRDIKGFTDLDKWHYEAFTGKSMAIQLHHVLCGKTKADLEGKTVTGSVTFHLYVPVATEFAFETGTTSLVRGMHKAGEQVNSSVQGDPNHPYTGSVSAKSYDTLTHNIDFSFAGNITTGVEGVGVEDAPVEFYNLQGVRMTSETLAPGIYIRRQGNETSKVYIR